ncbi:MAG: cyclase family protein [Xanthomonadales bacterium]|nr:cyclase family protein [Xanthomonadales bacterium]
MRNLILCTFCLSVTLVNPAGADPFDGYRMVDLSHGYGPETLYWPTSPSRFERTELAYGETDAGFFYAANSICTPEHGGTHLDAPIHFHADGLTTDEVPLDRLIAPAVVIDISAASAANPDYRMSVEDIERHEGEHGAIPSGSIIIARTGWSTRWPDAKDYLGDDTPGDASNLHFPSFGKEAAQMLVEERQAAAIGIDTASIDYGQSRDFPVHQIAAGRNVPGLENLTNLEELPARGAYLIALPMKIEGGSGGPARVVALVPETSSK